MMMTPTEGRMTVAHKDHEDARRMLGAQPRKVQVERHFVVTHHMMRDTDTQRLSMFYTKSFLLSSYSLIPSQFDLS
jgi:hypothetical protein